MSPKDNQPDDRRPVTVCKRILTSIHPGHHILFTSNFIQNLWLLALWRMTVHTCVCNKRMTPTRHGGFFSHVKLLTVQREAVYSHQIKYTYSIMMTLTFWRKMKKYFLLSIIILVSFWKFLLTTEETQGVCFHIF